MKKAVIFPHNREAEIIMDNLEYIKDYQILGVLEGDISNLYSIYGKNLTQKVDTLILMDNVQQLDMKTYKNRIEWAKKNQLEILGSSSLMRKVGTNYFENCSLNILENMETDLYNIGNKNKFKDVLTPVISIMGLGENSDKFMVQVELANYFVKQGYKPILLSSNSLAKLMGWDVLPKFLFADNISFNKKIDMFNNYLYMQEREYRPDVFIIGCPSGIMRFSENENNFYGEVPLIIHSAVKTDVGVLCLYNGQFNSMYLDKLSSYCEYRLGVSLNKFCLSQQEYRNNPETERIEYLFLGSEKAGDKITKIKDEKYSVYAMSRVDLQYLADEIIEELSNNLEAL